MDSGTKDTLANVSTFTGLGLTMAEIQSTISILVLLTALFLNVSRLYDWYKKSK